MMTKLLGGVTLILLAFWSGMFGLWAASREPPSVILRVEVVTPRVPPGGTLEARYTVLRKDLCQTTIERSLTDSAGTRHLMPSQFFSIEPGPIGDDVYVSPAAVPIDAAPGPARYQVIASYSCNPLHVFWPIVEVMPAVVFTIG